MTSLPHNISEYSPTTLSANKLNGKSGGKILFCNILFCMYGFVKEYILIKNLKERWDLFHLNFNKQTPKKAYVCNSVMNVMDINRGL